MVPPSANEKLDSHDLHTRMLWRFLVGSFTIISQLNTRSLLQGFFGMTFPGQEGLGIKWLAGRNVDWCIENILEALLIVAIQITEAVADFPLFWYDVELSPLPLV